jgi:SAM-dependent methyltransferase
MTPEGEIHGFWDERAKAGRLSAGEVTHNDIWQRWLEIETTKRYLAPTMRLLDVGCGNGFATRQYAPLVRATIAIDYSESMIQRAISETAAGVELSFHHADVLELGPERFGMFDAAITTRCLINLQSWEDQQRALGNIASVLQPGGRLVFIEGWAQGRARLNEMRRHVGLPEMPPVWHNIDFDDEALLATARSHFRLVDRRHFGVYDFVARVVHPLMVDPEPPKYDAGINEVGARLALHQQEYGGISRVLYLVLERI